MAISSNGTCGETIRHDKANSSLGLLNGSSLLVAFDATVALLVDIAEKDITIAGTNSWARKRLSKMYT
jgi:hypothetical protein